MTPWTVAHQALLSLGFPRQEYCSGLPFPSPGGLFHPGVKPMFPVLAGRFFTTEPPGKPEGGSNPHPPASGQQEVHLPLSSYVGCLVPSGPPVTYRYPDLEEGGHPRLASGSQPACGDLCGHLLPALLWLLDAGFPCPCSCCHSHPWTPESELAGSRLGGICSLSSPRVALGRSEP